MPTMSSTHPWERHLNVRTAFKQSRCLAVPNRNPPPLKYAKKSSIAPPDPLCARTYRECSTLEDVVAFRARHSLSGHSPRTSSAVQSVLYRNTDVAKGKGEYTMLEAVHFEVFMPDRQDLRFVAVKTASMPRGCVEGHLFAVFDLQMLKRPLPSLKLQEEYRIRWTARHFEILLIEDNEPVEDLIYVAHVMESGDARAVCVWSPSYITVDFEKSSEKLEKDRLYEATLIPTSSAWIFPVEPPKNRADYSKLVANVRSSSVNTGIFAEQASEREDSQRLLIPNPPLKIHALSEHLKEILRKRLQVQIIPENFLLHLFKLGINYRVLNTPPERFNIRIKQIDPPELIVLSEVYGISYVTIHLFPNDSLKTKEIFLTVNSIVHPKRGNHHHSLLKCAPTPRMKAEFPAFKNGRCPTPLPLVSASLHREPNSITIQSIETIERIIEESENGSAKERAIELSIYPPQLSDYLYSKMQLKNEHQQPLPAPRSLSIRRSSDCFKPNERQSAAIGLYHEMDTPAFCIRSPPGSGKTTVAAAMAVSLENENKRMERASDVQLLLAVQNSAVANLAVAVQSFDIDSLKCYHIKSLVRTDADSESPFGIKALLSTYKQYMPKADDSDLEIVIRYLEIDNALHDSESALSARRRHKLTLEWHNSMRKAKLALERYLEPQIIFSTVDLALCYAMKGAGRGIGRILSSVTRIIIDEASLLTESTFYCLVRYFPKAKFVLIGDDKQLPPFMFDAKITAHLLTARSALSIAMENGSLPIIELVEVYRAPPRLIDPYNILSYEHKLISRKIESSFPLTEIGLVEQGKPQLLLIGNQGAQTSGGYQSLWNMSEIEAVVALVEMFPADVNSQIMIICLYKEQKRQLEIVLETSYELHTVDSSQGKEKPIVVVLTSRSENCTPFFASRPRCTVAVSRHQSALVIIGSNILLSGDDPWKTVIESAQFTTISARDLPPVGEDVKHRLEALDNTDKGYETMAKPTRMTYEQLISGAEVPKEKQLKSIKKKMRK